MIKFWSVAFQMSPLIYLHMYSYKRLPKELPMTINTTDGGHGMDG